MPEQAPEDLADHAEDFAHRYAEVLDDLTGDRMADLGIPTEQIGSRDPARGHACFMPHERTGGGNDPAGGLTLDSGVLNPELLGTLPGSEEWARGRLRDRIDAAIAHEYEEARRGGSHFEALLHSPETELPIREGARDILRAMRPRGTSAMIHDLTIGHLDPRAIRDGLAIAIEPLDPGVVARLLATFPGLKVEERDGYLVAPWHGREDGERGESFAARIQEATGCLVADRRNRRIVELRRGLAAKTA